MLKNHLMKKFVVKAIFAVILISLSSCRSTSNPCGLAKNSTEITKDAKLNSFFIFSKNIG